MFSFKKGRSKGKKYYNIRDIELGTDTADKKPRKVAVRFLCSDVAKIGITDAEQDEELPNSLQDIDNCAGPSDDINSSEMVRKQRLAGNWEKLRKDLVF